MFLGCSACGNADRSYVEPAVAAARPGERIAVEWPGGSTQGQLLRRPFQRHGRQVPLPVMVVHHELQADTGLPSHLRRRRSAA